VLFSANIAFEQGVIVAVIVTAIFIYTRFCASTHVQFTCTSYIHIHQHTFSHGEQRLCSKTPTPEVGLQNLRSCSG